jgi:hypothetical protein
MLDKLPSVVTVATFSALSLAVSHEWAYFSVIGPEYQALYTTSDYITLLIWGAGAVFLTVVIFGVIHLVTYRSDDFTLPPFSAEKTFGGFMDRNFNLILVGLLALVLFFFSTAQVNIGAYLLLVYIVMRALLYIFRHEKTRRYSKGWLALLVYGLPLGMIFLYGIGKSSAYTDIGISNARYELRLKEQLVNRDVEVLRFLEKGVIVFDPQTRKVEFFRHDLIARVSKKMPDLDSRSFACKRWEIMCVPAK